MCVSSGEQHRDGAHLRDDRVREQLHGGEDVHQSERHPHGHHGLHQARLLQRGGLPLDVGGVRVGEQGWSRGGEEEWL